MLHPGLIIVNVTFTHDYFGRCLSDMWQHWYILFFSTLCIFQFTFNAINYYWFSVLFQEEAWNNVTLSSGTKELYDFCGQTFQLISGHKKYSFFSQGNYLTSQELKSNLISALNKQYFPVLKYTSCILFSVSEWWA